MKPEAKSRESRILKFQQSQLCEIFPLWIPANGRGNDDREMSRECRRQAAAEHASTQGENAKPEKLRGQTVIDGSVTWLCLYSPGYSTSAVWQPSTDYAAGSVIKDSRGDFEIATGGQSGGDSAPSWPVTTYTGSDRIDVNANGKTTPDGSGTLVWTMGQGCPGSELCRSDVFIAEMK